MRVGLVGAGYFAQFQLRAWQRLHGAELVALAEQDPARLAAADVPGRYGSAQAMLDAEPLDLLDIATPPPTHAALIRTALGRVPAIICQKPFATSLEEAEALTAEAQAAGTRLIIHENFRFQPWYREIAALIAMGALGEILQARFALRPGDGAGAEAYQARQPYFRQMKRFLIRETGIHLIDVFRYLLPPPRAVYADLRQINPVIRGEDAGLVIFDLDGGARAVFDGNRVLDHAAKNMRLTMGELELEGSEGALRLAGDGAITLRKRGCETWHRHPYDFDDIDFGGNCVEAFQAHVLAGLAGTAPLETEAADYLANLRLEALVYAAAQAGRKLPVPDV